MAGSIRYAIEQYSFEKLKEAVAQRSFAPAYILDRKQQLAYLDSYLIHQDIGVMTMLVESDYIDRDYLADYSGYYVRCFAPYGRRCARLHFFSTKIDPKEFDNILSGRDTKLSVQELQEHYIGFVVIKPLPETVIGRTCLKTFEPQDGRAYPSNRNYDVNLFGIKLRVCSLAFQEQDSVAAACASSALWSAFHGTGFLFQHDIPSPLAITRMAVERIPSLSRALPAKDGLSDLQMAEAVRGVGLDPLTLSVDSNWMLKATAYAYLKSGIPVVWGGIAINRLPEETQPSELHTPISVMNPSPNEIGGHAITLVGYKLDLKNSSLTNGAGEILLRSSRINRLYVHDDGVGAFARVIFEESKLSIGGMGTSDWFSCRWIDDAHGRSYVSENVLVPLFTTIRIPFNSILMAMIYFDATLNVLQTNEKTKFATRFEWDIFLISSNEFKSSALNEKSLNGERLADLMLSPLPRYLWIATAYSNNIKIFDFIFDSTDIEQGLKLLQIVPHDEDAYEELLVLSDVYSADPAYAMERLYPHGKIWEHIRQLFDASKNPGVAET